LFKIRKISLYIITVSYLILTIIEFIKYLLIDSNLYGLIYLIICLIIIFLIIPIAYNYKNNYSKIRFSKFVITIILGIFNSFILNHIVIGNMSYVDSSNIYNNSIFVIKNILKLFLYLSFVFYALRDIKVYKSIMNYINKKKNID